MVGFGFLLLPFNQSLNSLILLQVGLATHLVTLSLNQLLGLAQGSTILFLTEHRGKLKSGIAENKTHKILARIIQFIEEVFQVTQYFLALP